MFNPDWTCRNNFKYKIGETYKHKGKIKLCGKGFHFCRKLMDCFNYYKFDPKNKVALVEATGEVIDGDDKSVTNEITILKEISWYEVLDMTNTGNGNTGYRNTGNCNSGNWNTGNRNTGNCNSGNWNSGDRNSGNWNSGDRNSGNCNSGNCNSGDRNSGNWNTGNRNTGDKNIGDWNSGDFNISNYNSGCFNTKTHTIYMFNEPSNWTYKDWLNSHSYDILSNVKLTEWIDIDDMTDEEKEQHPEYKTTKGYLKEYTYKEACKNMWNELTEKERKIIVTELPNFDKGIFKEITSIDVDED